MKLEVVLCDEDGDEDDAAKAFVVVSGIIIAIHAPIVLKSWIASIFTIVLVAE